MDSSCDTASALLEAVMVVLVVAVAMVAGLICALMWPFRRSR